MQLSEPLDQATGLRRLFTPEPAFRALGVLGADGRNCARASLALARGLARRGERVMVLDEAPAPHHVGGLLGVLARHTLADVRHRSLVDIVQPAEDGISLLSAPDGLTALAGLSEADLRDLAEDWHNRAEAPEWLVVNGGACAQDFGLAATADERVLVLPGTKSRLAEAYAVLKAAHGLRPARAWWVLVDNADEVQAQALFASLRETAQRFLDVAPECLGHLPRQKPGLVPGPLDGGHMDHLSDAAAGGTDLGRVSFLQYWQRMWLHSRMVSERAALGIAMEGRRHVRWRSG